MRVQLSGRRFLSGERTFLTFFVVGLVAGMFIVNIGKSILLGDTGLFNEHMLYQMKDMSLDGNALFCYVFRKRIGRLLILAVISTTYLGMAACMGAALWYGMSAGAFLTALALRYGLKGILLALVSIFPQYLLYVPAVLAMLPWCRELFRGIYVRGDFSAGDKGFLLKKAGRLAGILAAVITGCLLEGYINPWLVLGFLKIF